MGLVVGDAPEDLQGAGNRDLWPCRPTDDGVGLDLVGFPVRSAHRLHAGDKLIERQFGDAGGREEPEAARLGEIAGGLILCLGVSGVASEASLPCREHPLPSAERLPAGLGFAVSFQGDPDVITGLHPLVSDGDAAAHVEGLPLSARRESHPLPAFHPASAPFDATSIALDQVAICAANSAANSYVYPPHRRAGGYFSVVFKGFWCV